MRRTAFIALLLGAVASFPVAAQEAFPNRPIRLVVPFAAGGPSDIIARIVAPRMATTLGQPIVVENRAGAGGVTGVDVIAKSRPDGYTFGIGSAGAIAISPSLGRGTPYDPTRDLAPVTLAALVPEPLVVPGASPFRTVQDLVSAARARPGALNFGSTGNGSMPHLAAEQLRAAANLIGHAQACGNGAAVVEDAHHLTIGQPARGGVFRMHQDRPACRDASRS